MNFNTGIMIHALNVYSTPGKVKTGEGLIRRATAIARWSFLTNYGLVLTYIGRHSESTGLEIAHAVGITERATRVLFANLQGARHVEREKVGRRSQYRINAEIPFQTLGERAVTVGELLELLSRDDREKGAAVQPVETSSTPGPRLDQR